MPDFFIVLEIAALGIVIMTASLAAFIYLHAN
jgi:hypothetical protein